jgi:L-asparaginase II
VLRAVKLATGLEEITVGVDGCGAPVHGMPLAATAGIYARLAAADLGEWSQHAHRATAAMIREPYMVAGRNRVDTAVMELSTSVAVKAGAEGLLCAGSVDRTLGVAIKVRDGTSRAAGPALIRTLRSPTTLVRRCSGAGSRSENWSPTSFSPADQVFAGVTRSVCKC